MNLIRGAVSEPHLAALQKHVAAPDTPTLYAETKIACDLTSDRDLVRCLHPALAHFGSQPVLAYRIFERWNGETWFDKSDL